CPRCPGPHQPRLALRAAAQAAPHALRRPLGPARPGGPPPRRGSVPASHPTRARRTRPVRHARARPLQEPPTPPGSRPGARRPPRQVPPGLHRSPCPYCRTASGTNAASRTAHHSSDPATGCATGHAASAGTGALPNRPRSAVATALTGFHSATCAVSPRADQGGDPARAPAVRAARTGRLLVAGEQPEAAADPDAGETAQEERRDGRRAGWPTGSARDRDAGPRPGIVTPVRDA